MAATAIALNRFGLGARPSVPAPADPKAWLLGQLSHYQARPPALASLPARTEVVQQLSDYIAEARTEARTRKQPQPAAMPMNMEQQQPGDGLPDSARRYLRQSIRSDYMEMNAARLGSALTTSAPFLERLVHFWANHFAVSADKLPVIALAGLLEFEAIRPNVLGRFSDLLIAVEQHPAMLIYLDQAQSIGPNSQAGRFIAARRQQKRGLNENLAREILELHTLGVRTGYSQDDVIGFANILTGWTLVPPGDNPEHGGEFTFNPRLHEPGAQKVLGKSYDDETVEQGRAVLRDLAANPATATHVATKLVRHFVADAPPPALVERMSKVFLDTGGDLKQVAKVMVSSDEA